MPGAKVGLVAVASSTSRLGAHCFHGVRFTPYSSCTSPVMYSGTPLVWLSSCRTVIAVPSLPLRFTTPGSQ